MKHKFLASLSPSRTTETPARAGAILLLGVLINLSQSWNVFTWFLMWLRRVK